jgi:hypothetical protein
LQLLIIKSNAMKNLIYVFAIAIMGLVACGTPAEKEACTAVEEATDSTAVETTDSTVVEEMVTEEVEAESAE